MGTGLGWIPKEESTFYSSEYLFQSKHSPQEAQSYQTTLLSKKKGEEMLGVKGIYSFPASVSPQRTTRKIKITAPKLTEKIIKYNKFLERSHKMKMACHGIQFCRQRDKLRKEGRRLRSGR